jgi:hypothetical protein
MCQRSDTGWPSIRAVEILMRLADGNKKKALFHGVPSTAGHCHATLCSDFGPLSSK